LYRAVEQYRPTLLVDECQWLTRRQSESAEALRDLLCAGVERSATVLRIGGPDRDRLQRFHVYSPKVLAHIGEPDDVLADRSILIRMERKQAGEPVSPWRSRVVEAEANDLARQLRRWADDHASTLADISDALDGFSGVNDRAAEMWAPLQAVVIAADTGRVPELQAAARALTPQDTDRESAGVQLLAALRSIFDAAGADFLATDTVLEKLHGRQDEPWATWSRGKPMTPHGLSAQLRRFKVKPAHSPNKTARGYFRDHLSPAWGRYLGEGG
jgi:hypothetical protein